jgi:RHS repeat-associated protein
LTFGDQQGSATVMMQVTLDASGAMAPAAVTDPITRNAYTPYGAVRGADNLTIDHGWLNKIADTDTGLTYLGARYYDPLVSRFVSPDPLMNPMDPRTLDAFMYANNNPVLFSDPTGLTPRWDPNTGKLGTEDFYADGSYLKTKLSMTPTTDVVRAWEQKAAKARSGSTNEVTRLMGILAAQASDAGTSSSTTGANGSTGTTGANGPTGGTGVSSPGGSATSAQSSTVDSDSGGSIFSTIWKGARTLIHSVNPITSTTSAVAGGWATMHGAHCGFSGQEWFMVCGGATSGYANGGTMYGSVFVTGTPTDTILNQDNPEQVRVLAHEAKHGDQMINLAGPGGVLFVQVVDQGFIWVGSLFDGDTADPNWECNVVERGANYEDGGYDRCT